MSRGNAEGAAIEGKYCNTKAKLHDALRQCPNCKLTKSLIEIIVCNNRDIENQPQDGYVLFAWHPNLSRVLNRFQFNSMGCTH